MESFLTACSANPAEQQCNVLPLLAQLQEYSTDVRAIYAYCSLLANMRPFPFKQDVDFFPGKANLPCNVCKRPSTGRCLGCNFYAYCGKECQARDWKTWHKHNCYRNGIKTFYDLVRAAWTVAPHADHAPFAVVLVFDKNPLNVPFALSCLSLQGPIVDAAVCILCSNGYVLTEEEIAKLEVKCNSGFAKQNLGVYKQWLKTPKPVKAE